MKGEINNNYCDFMNGQFETPPHLKRETIVTDAVLLGDFFIVYKIYKKRQPLSQELQIVDVIGKIYFPKRKGKIRTTKKWLKKLIGDIPLWGYPIHTIWKISQKGHSLLLIDRQLIHKSSIIDIEDVMVKTMDNKIVKEIQQCKYQYEIQKEQQVIKKKNTMPLERDRRTNEKKKGVRVF